MKILIVSESINVEDSSASKGRVSLINNLKNIGFELRVLHFSHLDIFLKDIDCVLIKENKRSLNYFLSRTIRVLQRIFKVNINQYVEKLIGFSFTHTNDSKAIARGIRKNLDYNPDIILTLSKGASFRPHRAMLYLPDLHSKWVSYIHDPYPYHFYPRPFNEVVSGYQEKENFMRDVVNKSKQLIFPSSMLKEWMESYFPSVSKKSLIIPHQINSTIILSPMPDFFEEKQFTLLHAGNLLKERKPEFLIKGFIRFLEKNATAKYDSKLYLIGKNHHHIKVIEEFIDHPNIVIKDYIEYNSVQTLERNVTVNIILEAISEISPFLPGKFPNCIVADKPILILGPYYSEVRRLLGEEYPYWSEANDVDKIETIISDLYQKWKLSSKELHLNRNDLVEYCGKTYLQETFNSLSK